MPAIDIERLGGERNIWIGTLRPDDRPHFVPVWYVLHDEQCYISTMPESVKVRNIQRNPQVVLALEDTNKPLVVEGTARLVALGEAVNELFKTKYDWDLTTEKDYTQIIEVSLDRQLVG